ncbi:MAG: GNAT family N-acetyltransferase [Variovorax paradoxus]|nr:MAG: GNAT family N-acetyltransferase [Variovorax paradoxus]PZQ14493.1 MAG: GNAT family N-acetyltransferase [Variovorax paradoxus]
MRTVPVHFEPASAGDAEELAALRVVAMQRSLERIGRFDPERARVRFLSNFAPSLTRHLVVDRDRVGFVVVRHQSDHLLLDHLYVHPAHQGLGTGAAALAMIFEEADAAMLPIRVGALRESDSNRFYARHGFELVEQAEWDNYYVRKPKG